MAITPLRLAVVGLGLAGLMAATAALAGIDPPAPTLPPISHMYVLTQANCLPPQGDASGNCKAQDVPAGAEIEIQLPSMLAVWTLASISPHLTATGTEKLPNPGRLAGTSELTLWDFTAVRAGMATIVLREFPPTISTTPAGTFTYTFNIQ
jgi:hypothetical protein